MPNSTVLQYVPQVPTVTAYLLRSTRRILSETPNFRTAERQIHELYSSAPISGLFGASAL
jgi:hypothetical protein